MKQAAFTYEIRVEGQLDYRWLEWFHAMTIAYTVNGETILTDTMPDQAALYGVLMKMRDLGLTLVSVNRVQAES